MSLTRLPRKSGTGARLLLLASALLAASPLCADDRLSSRTATSSADCRSTESWTRFSRHHLEEFRAYYKAWPVGATPEIANARWVEYRSPRTEKLLPGYRIFFLPPRIAGNGPSRLFAVSGDSCIRDLGNGYLTAGAEDPGLQNLQRLLEAAGVEVKDEAQAILAGRLVEDLLFGTSCRDGVPLPGAGYPVCDERLDPDWTERERNWKWEARRSGTSWFVTREYAGPPASTMLPHVWRLETDSAGHLTGLRADE